MTALLPAHILNEVPKYFYRSKLTNRYKRPLVMARSHEGE